MNELIETNSVMYARKKTVVLVLWCGILGWSGYDLVNTMINEPEGLRYVLPFLIFVITPITFFVSIEYSLTDKGIEVGSWILRFLKLRKGRIGLVEWKRVELVELFPGEIAFFPIAPLGHLTTFMNTNSWQFLEELCLRVEREGDSPASEKLRIRIRNKSIANTRND